MLLILVVVLMTRVGRLRRAQTVVLGHHEQRDIVAHTEDLDSQVRNLREAVEILTDQLDDQKRHLDHALTNRAIIRYDAFRDAGGEQSASFALLDQYRSGVVFSAIAARDFARIYVKHISEGVADRDLSPEEVQAMEAAVPRPLSSGEQAPRAKRAPLPESPPPAGLGAAAADERDPAGQLGACRVAGGDRGVRGPRRRRGPPPGAAPDDRRQRWRRAAGRVRHRRLHLGAAIPAASRRRLLRPLTRPAGPSAAVSPAPPPCVPPTRPHAPRQPAWSDSLAGRSGATSGGAAGVATG